jgi:hypothetical protein
MNFSFEVCLLYDDSNVLSRYLLLDTVLSEIGFPTNAVGIYLRHRKRQGYAAVLSLLYRMT